MNEYEDRTYRSTHFSAGREAFTVCYRKSDLWVAVDKELYDPYMAIECRIFLQGLWSGMESYITNDPEYASSLLPYPAAESAPEILYCMSAAAAQAGIGPMGAVAGAVAAETAAFLKERYGCKEIIIENGGDIYAEFREDLLAAVFAGDSPLSGKIALRIPPEYSPVGICTSSGTVGPSLNFGQADAVVIVCKDAALADAYATAFANRVQTAADIDQVIEMIGAKKDILAGVIVKDDKVGIIGEFDMEIIG